MAGLKGKLQVLLDKSKGDDRLVAALRAELARARGETPGAASRTSGSAFYRQFSSDAAALPGGDADAAAGVNGPGAAAGGADSLLLRQRLQEAEDQIDKQQKARDCVWGEGLPLGAGAVGSLFKLMSRARPR